MRQFNYYGQINEEGDEEDVQKLEKEIEEVLKNRVGTANTYSSDRNIINIQKGKRGKSSQPKGNKNNIMGSPYKEVGDIGDDIYEDDESSEDDDDI